MRASSVGNCCEFEDSEQLTAEPRASLAKQDRPAEPHCDGRGDSHNQRAQQDERKQRDGHVEGSLDCAGVPMRPRSVIAPLSGEDRR